MVNKTNYIINKNAFLVSALKMLNNSPDILTLFVSDDDNKIIGAVTDGDIRRGLIKGLNNESTISEFMNSSFTFLKKGVYEKSKLDYIKSNKMEIIPVLNEDFTMFRIIDFTKIKTILPIDAVIMAGGKGSRLMPLTENTPKPMLEIGGKPIMEYNIDLLKSFGISHITLSVKYLAKIIEDYYQNGESRQLDISYVTENEPLGTIGAVKQIKEFVNDYILVMNSDLLTNINLEAMFNELLTNDADMIVATTDYQVKIPYGVVESNGNQIVALKEKPTYTYYSNAGIYILKKKMIDFIPEHTHFNATDLLEKGISENLRILHYPIKNYWLDIGKHADFDKAQDDVKHIQF